MIRARVALRLRWWVAPYCHALDLFAWLTGQQVDGTKLAALIARRGIKITVERG